MKTRPIIVSIAGFDPSNGAGLTADVKTMERLKCYGVAVCTANTVQNDVQFTNCYWTPLAIMEEQLTILFERFQIDYAKIGIVENWMVLQSIITALKELNPNIKIVLDPVLRSSTDFNFHNIVNAVLEEEFLDAILDQIYLITPNYQEIQQLYTEKSVADTLQHMASKTNVLLKGGHRENAIGKDQLFTTEGKEFTLQPKQANYYEKHGSGCVLSSAITSYLALKYPLLKACYKGKRYTEKVLSSNKSLLGYHG